MRYPSFLLQPRMWAEESIYYETSFSNLSFMDGFDAIKEICTFDPKAKIIVISADIQELSIKQALQHRL